MLTILLMGYSSGIPLALTASTLQAWMTKEGINIKTIGIYTLIWIPYNLKFLWAPILDRFSPPFLGRRRGWMVVSQIALIASILSLGYSNPIAEPFRIAFLGLLIAFFSASQDIVIDAYRAEILKPDELGPGASLAILGYRIGMISSSAGALFLADHYSWNYVYSFMSIGVVVGLVVSFLAKDSDTPPTPPKTIKEAVFSPLLDLIKRPAALGILSFTILYKIGDVMAQSFTTPFMLQIGFSMTEIAAVVKGFGLLATIFGAMIGGYVITKIGIKKSLFIFGLCQAFSSLCFAALAYVGHDKVVMTVAIAIENLSAGMGTAALTAFLMSLCNKRFTGTQYALLTSIAALSRTLVGVPSAMLSASFGWFYFFIFCMFAAIPGLVLVRKMHIAQ